MESYILILVCLGVLSSLTKTVVAYNGLLDNYLVGNVNTEEIGPNMEAATKFIETYKGTRRHAVLSSTQIQEWRTFVALQGIIDNPKCDDSEYELMRANEAIVGLQALKQKEMVNRRVDKIMLRIFKIHSEKCSDVYRKRYRSRKEQVDAVTWDRVLELCSAIMDYDESEAYSSRARKFYTADNVFTRYIRTVPLMDTYSNEGVFWSALRVSGKNDPNIKYIRRVADANTGKLVVHKDKIMQLSDEYLTKPCRKYVDAFKTDLFIPARFDASYYFNIDSTKREYYAAWSIFMICHSMLSTHNVAYDSVIRTAYNS